MAGKKVRARFSLSNIEGGKFNLKLNKRKSNLQEEIPLNLNGEPDSSSFSKTLKPSFLQASTHAKSELQEGNETLTFFNNIEIMLTPKRKSAVAI